MSTPALTALGPLRHQCFGCGNCCHGHWVPMLDDDEAARIERHAVTLGVANPVEDGGLRRVDGTCVFLDTDNLCRIHKQMGGVEKPLRCQLWPLKVLRTEGELRIGIDPGCTNSWRSFDGDEVLDDERLVVREQPLSPGERQFELGLIGAAAADGFTIGRLAGLIAGMPGHTGPDLPPGMASRLATRLKALRLRQLLGLSDLGKALVTPLYPIADMLDALDPASPPAWGGRLNDRADAFARDVLRRRLYLREAPMAPAVHGLALVMLAGIVACGWTDPALDKFGPMLSHWSRLAAQRALWLRLAPEPEHLRWMATGQYAGSLGTDIVIGDKGA